METPNSNPVLIEILQKIMRYIAYIIPFFGIAIIAMICVSLYHSKSGISLWALPRPLTFNFFLTLFMLYQMKKKNYQEMTSAHLKKDNVAMTFLLATNIVSIILLCLNMVYVIINPFGLKY
jgi:uncharacterized membrane protein